MPSSSPAERLDAAVDHLLAGEQPHTDTEIRRLVEVATLLREALPRVPPASRFEARLAARLTVEAAVGRNLRAFSAAARRELTPARLIAAGAVSSAAVGVTAIAVWRGSRRPGGVGHRLLHR